MLITTCFVVKSIIPAKGAHNDVTFIHSNSIRQNCTCRQRNGSENGNKNRSSRSRAFKRSILYNAMIEYADHFKTLLESEFRAEEAVFKSRQNVARTVSGTRASPDVLVNLVATKRQRVFSYELYALSSANSLGCLPKEHTFTKGDLIDISLNDDDGSNRDVIQGSVLSRLEKFLLVTFPIGSQDALRMDAFTEARISLRASRGMSTIAYDRATMALESFSKRGPGNSECTRLLVLTFAGRVNEEFIAQSLDQPQEFRSFNGLDCPSNDAVNWESLAREDVSRFRQTDFNVVIKSVAKILNSSQYAALKRAVRSRLTLVQGPPGTGKTVTAAEIISASLKLGVRRILVVASSNVAVDNLLRKTSTRCDATCKILRMGKVSSIAEDVWSHSLDNVLERHRDVVRVRQAYSSGNTSFSELEKVQKQVTASTLEKAHVIFATCVGSGADEMTRLNFDMIIVDEATQATEPDVLIALTCGVNIPQQIVLIGDHHQLPPTVLSEKPDGKKIGLETSLFMRLWLCGIRCELLNVQYRMHPAISRFPNKHFYKMQVTDGLSASDRPLPTTILQNVKWIPQASRVILFPVNDGFEENEGSTWDTHGSSMLNRREAEVVTSLIRVLTSHGKDHIDIGIISPYSAQVKLLRDALLRERTPASVEVNTVDGFQGREKDIIIISAVRSNKEKKVGFLSDWRRLNVALTRSRLLLIMVGSEVTISSDFHWRSWLSWTSRHGRIIRPEQLKENGISRL